MGISLFPNLTFRLLRSADFPANMVAFRIPPSLHKFDIKNYLQSVYGLRVLKVRTVNYEGRRKGTGVLATKESDWKKAIVEFDGKFEYPSITETPPKVESKSHHRPRRFFR